jgi:hypothetical protein
MISRLPSQQEMIFGLKYKMCASFDAMFVPFSLLACLMYSAKHLRWISRTVVTTPKHQGRTSLIGRT